MYSNLNGRYYIDGDSKLSQTFAIMKYIAGKHNLVPNTEKERLRVNLLEGEAEDFRHMWAMLCAQSNHNISDNASALLCALSNVMQVPDSG